MVETCTEASKVGNLAIAHRKKNLNPFSMGNPLIDVSRSTYFMWQIASIVTVIISHRAVPFAGAAADAAAAGNELEFYPRFRKGDVICCDLLSRGHPFTAFRVTCL